MIVFIKTHGRPDRQYTYETLRQSGYTGEIIFMTDDEDNTSYRLREFTDNDSKCSHVEFSKRFYVDTVDSFSAVPKRDVNLYAWCACEDYAHSLACDNFIMADDDITSFRYRFLENQTLKSLKITSNLNKLFKYIFDYMNYADIKTASTGMPQMYFSKDIANNMWKYRVPYQFVFRNGNYKMKWVSEYEEDIISAIRLSNEGNYCTVIPIVQHDAVSLGTSSGGMCNVYTQSRNRFNLAQYGFIHSPSCREIKMYKNNWMCQIKRDNTFSKLVSSCCKKC